MHVLTYPPYNPLAAQLPSPRYRLPRAPLALFRSHDAHKPVRHPAMARSWLAGAQSSFCAGPGGFLSSDLGPTTTSCGLTRLPERARRAASYTFTISSPARSLRPAVLSERRSTCSSAARSSQCWRDCACSCFGSKPGNGPKPGPVYPCSLDAGSQKDRILGSDVVHKGVLG